MRIIEVSDLNAPELAPYARLTEAQLRNRKSPEEGIFIAESPKVIKVALEAGLTPVSMLMERRHIEGDAAGVLALGGNIPVYTGPRELLSSLTGYTLTRGVLCAMLRPAPPDIRELCRGARRLAVLEGVVDATNIGAIFRSAAALGIDGALLTETCCDPLNRRAVRVSMGTVFKIPWCYISPWPEPGLGELRALGFRTAAMALSGDSVSVDDPRLKAEPKLAIVLGAEGDGLSRETIARCDYTVKIPMSRGVDSLNVAAASALAFWELRIGAVKG